MFYGHLYAYYGVYWCVILLFSFLSPRYGLYDYADDDDDASLSITLPSIFLIAHKTRAQTKSSRGPRSHVVAVIWTSRIVSETFVFCLQVEEV